jgi:hypothetical protein
MLSRLDLLLKIHARNRVKVMNIVVHKDGKIPKLVEVELMIALKTTMEEQIVDLSSYEDLKVIFTNTNFAFLKLKVYPFCFSFFDVCHQSR